jgi:hypothetical protein
VTPALYVLLVGEPGMRKSVAVNIAKRLLRDSGVETGDNSTTREALIELLAKLQTIYNIDGKQYFYNQVAVTTGEFSDLLGKTKLDEQMVKLLTSIWEEAEYKASTVSRGRRFIENPYLTVLSACTPDWFRDNLHVNLIGDGFVRRMVFVFAEKLHTLSDWPERDLDSELYKQLQERAKKVSSFCGSFRITEEGLEWWHGAYRDWMAEASNKTNRLNSYYSSKHILVLKVAMALSATCRDDLLLDSDTLFTADQLLKETEAYHSRLFAGVGRNELKKFAEKLLTFVAVKGKVRYVDIVSHLMADVNQRELIDLMTSCVDSGQLRVDSEGFYTTSHKGPMTGGDVGLCLADWKPKLMEKPHGEFLRLSPDAKPYVPPTEVDEVDETSTAKKFKKGKKAAEEPGPDFLEGL